MFDRVAAERDEAWLVTALKRRWWVVALVAIIAVASAYEVSNRQQKKYTATSALLFLNSDLSQQLVGQAQIVDNSDPSRAAATNQSLIELPTVAAMVASSLHVPAGRVVNDLSFGGDQNSDVVTVSVSDPSPPLAAQIANAYVADYIKFRKTAAISELNNAENLINRKLANLHLQGKGPSSPVTQALISDRNQIDLLKSAQTGDAQVVQLAGVPTSPSSPKPKTTALIGLLLGLLLGGALVAVLERRDRRIKDVELVEQIYGAPVIGAVPESSALRGNRPLRPREEEPFVMLRAQLRYFDLDREIKRVLVTSADSGEGKTMVSLNLARAAARADGKRALLIEADMRRPTLSRLIHRDFVAGLSELLSHSQDVESGLRELVVSPALAEPNGHAQHNGHPQPNGHALNLDVLLAGSPPANPGELIESTRMQQVLDVAESLYDIVIIDTAPIGAVSDAMPLVQRVDGVLVITRIGKSRRDHAVRLMKWLRGLNAHVLGVVVNSFKPSADQSYGYYGGYEYEPRRRTRRLVGGRSRQKVES